MSDQRSNILTAIDNALDGWRASGQVLEEIHSHCTLFTAADAPPDYGLMSPLLIVSAPSVESTPHTLCASFMQKILPVTFSLFTENQGDTRRRTASSLIDLVETAFYNQTFGYSKHVDVTSKDYTQTSISGFSDTWAGAAELTITHMYLDVRDEVMATPWERTVSDDLTLLASTVIPSTYDSVRVQGAVTLTSTPSIQAGEDGQRITIFGISDSAIPTLQDEQDLAGSGVILQHHRPFSFGKNDNMELEFNASQAKWLEIRRNDLS